MNNQGFTPELELSRLKKYRLDGIIQKLTALPSLPGNDIIISPNDKKWKEYYYYVTPEDIDHLKLLAGVSSDAASHPLYKFPDKNFSLSQIPEAQINKNELTNDQEINIYNAAHNILFGNYDKELLQNGLLSTVVNFMIKKADGMTIFAAQDLIVKDGQTITFENTATLYFNRVVVYGSGQIKIGAQVKIIADLIERIKN